MLVIFIILIICVLISIGEDNPLKGIAAFVGSICGLILLIWVIIKVYQSIFSAF